MTDLFTADDLISAYTDAQALEDGVLVDLPAIGCRVTFHGRPVNRMTGHLYAEMEPFLIGPSDLAQTIRTKLRYARDTADPGSMPDVLYELPPDLYLEVNETGGFTMLFPEER